MNRIAVAQELVRLARELCSSDKIVWEKEGGDKQTFYVGRIDRKVIANIIQNLDESHVTLSINGYQFRCRSVRKAKEEAEDRIKANRGVYLTF